MWEHFPTCHWCQHAARARMGVFMGGGGGGGGGGRGGTRGLGEGGGGAIGHQQQNLQVKMLIVAARYQNIVVEECK